MKFPIPIKYFEKELKGHPAYPSLAALTDTLDAVGISNAALQVNRENAHNIPMPFLAQITRNKTPQLVMVSNREQLANKEFLNSWDGISIVAELPEGFSLSPFYAEQLKTEQRTKWKVVGIIALVCLFITAILIRGFSITSLLLITSSAAGVIVAILLRMHSLGIKTDLIENLCTSGQNTDCDAVIHSKGAKLPFSIELTDIGFIYFAGMLVCTLLNAYSNAYSGYSILSLFAICSVPFTIFSLAYQRFIVKKWCPLCVTTVIILWVQAGLLWPYLPASVPVISESLTVIVLFGAIAGLYLYANPHVRSIASFIRQAERNKRFKYDPDIFSALIANKRKIDTKPFKNDLQIANSNAPIQISVACSPYCQPCAKAHIAFERLITAFPETIGISVRFSVNSSNIQDKRTIAVMYILSVIEQEPAGKTNKILHDWFEHMDLQKFKKLYPLAGEADVMQVLHEHSTWSTLCNITRTPTIFLNGYELPGQYTVEDLPGLIRNMNYLLAAKVSQVP